jgi:DNA-binding IscR family transcriptional regulator
MALVDIDKGRYAVRMMLDMALDVTILYHHQEISERQGISSKYLKRLYRS